MRNRESDEDGDVVGGESCCVCAPPLCPSQSWRPGLSGEPSVSPVTSSLSSGMLWRKCGPEAEGNDGWTWDTLTNTNPHPQLKTLITWIYSTELLVLIQLSVQTPPKRRQILQSCSVSYEILLNMIKCQFRAHK